MKTLFAVTLVKGEGWNESEPMCWQEKWNEHAAFMDELAANGFVVLGGPVGDGDDTVLLAVDADDESEIRVAFAKDPWFALQIRKIDHIQRWTILLQAGGKA